MNNEMIDGGYIIISRQILENEIWFKTPAFLKIFIYILLKVNHKKGMFGVGENFFNFQDEKIYGVTKNQIYEFLRWAKSEKIQFCTTQKTTRGTVLKVRNYNYFQDPQNYKTQNTLQNRHKTDTKQTQNDKQECKNERSINLSLSNSSTRANEREREILKTYCKRNNVKNVDAYIRKLIDNGDAKTIVQEEKLRLEKKEQRRQEQPPQEVESPEATQKGYEAFLAAKARLTGWRS